MVWIYSQRHPDILRRGITCKAACDELILVATGAARDSTVAAMLSLSSLGYYASWR